jgi:hypothetical protein
MKQQVTQVALSVIAGLSFSAMAAPKPAVIEVAPKIEVTAPPVKVEGLQTGTTMSLDAFKQSITPVNPVVNQNALDALNAQEATTPETCGSKYVADKIIDRVPSLKGSEGLLAKAVDDGLLRAGCGEGGLLGVENTKVVENVAETVACVERAGGNSLGSQLDEVGGGCLLDAKKNDADSPVATMDPKDAIDQAIADYQAVGKCWFKTEATVH